MRRPAASAFKTGDVILKWNEHVATDPTLLSRAIAATEIGSTAKLVLVRQTGKDKKQSRARRKSRTQPDREEEANAVHRSPFAPSSRPRAA